SVGPLHHLTLSIGILIPRVADARRCVLLLLLLPYGIGVQLLGGKLARCYTASGGVLPVNQDVCDSLVMFGSNSTYYSTLPISELPIGWLNPPSGNFDHIGAAMLALFEVATLEMWPDAMYGAV